MENHTHTKMRKRIGDMKKRRAPFYQRSTCTMANDLFKAIPFFVLQQRVCAGHLFRSSTTSDDRDSIKSITSQLQVHTSQILRL